MKGEEKKSEIKEIRVRKKRVTPAPAYCVRFLRLFWTHVTFDDQSDKCSECVSDSALPFRHFAGWVLVKLSYRMHR